jgi:hypothetical protein
VQQLVIGTKLRLHYARAGLATTVTDKPVAAAMAAKTKVRKTAEASARPVAAAPFKRKDRPRRPVRDQRQAAKPVGTRST